MRGVHQTGLDFIQKHEVRGLCIKLLMRENLIMSSGRWVVSASGIACSLKTKLKVPQCIIYTSAGRKEHRTAEDSSSIFTNRSWILWKRQIEDKFTRSDLVMMLWWYWNELRFVWNVSFSSHFHCSKTTFRTTRRPFRTMDSEKYGVV